MTLIIMEVAPTRAVFRFLEMPDDSQKINVCKELGAAGTRLTQILDALRKEIEWLSTENLCKRFICLLTLSMKRSLKIRSRQHEHTSQCYGPAWLTSEFRAQRSTFSPFSLCNISCRFLGRSPKQVRLSTTPILPRTILNHARNRSRTVGSKTITANSWRGT
jgi:hypothetical protein